jgi:hypothetical protein
MSRKATRTGFVVGPVSTTSRRDSGQIDARAATSLTTSRAPHLPFVFRRLLAAGENHGLPLLSSLDPCGPHELDKQQAQKLADEVRVIENNEPSVVAIAQLALWCARARANPWLSIIGT